MTNADWPAWLIRKLRPKTPEAVREAASASDLPFDPMTLDFERGVEFGMLFARLKERGHVEMAVHADMAEMVIRLAEKQGEPFSGCPHEHDEDCPADHGDMEADWLDVTIGPVPG